MAGELPADGNATRKRLREAQLRRTCTAGRRPRPTHAMILRLIDGRTRPIGQRHTIKIY
jgi:hypothetical protein